MRVERGILLMTAKGGGAKGMPSTKRPVEITLLPGTEECCIRLKCGVSQSKDYDVLVGMELLYKVGATICTWQEKLLYRTQYWDPESSVGTLPVHFVKQEPRAAYRAEEVDLPKELDNWTWQEYAEEGQRRIEQYEGERRATDLKERVSKTWCLDGALCILELYGGIGTGLTAALKARCFVGRWIHVEKDPVVRKMARHHSLKLLEEYPQQMLITTIPTEEEVTVHDVRDITEQ
ncbi:unnamed protein product [Closterium sp. NIES-53]